VQRNEVVIIEGLLSGSLTIDRVKATPSELITACLAVGRYESLPSGHQHRATAWLSLESEQQTIVRQYNRTFRSFEHRPQSASRLLALAMGDSYQGGVVADFFLSLFASERYGGFDVGNITVLDQSIVNDIADVITLIGLSEDVYPPEWLITETEVKAVVARWRPPRVRSTRSLFRLERPHRPHNQRPRAPGYRNSRDESHGVLSGF
jgi:hypothetical protein